ncbi:MAG: hypothetical protein RIQ89_880 [Bacteroidota bacterium]
MNYNFFRAILMVSIFLLLILFPLLNDTFHLIKDFENTENRKVASLPAFNIELLDPYPIEFNNFYTDNFTIRHRLIKYYNHLNLKYYKKSPLPNQVLIGKNSWLYLVGNEVNCFRGKQPFTEAELKTLKSEFEYRQQYLATLNCKFYLLIAPVKASIYPENLPLGMIRLMGLSWGEQLNNYLSKNSTVKTIDLFTALRSNKSDGLNYYMLDNHWNQKGGMIAAQEALRMVKKDLLPLDTINLADYELKDSMVNSGNLAMMLSNTKIFNDSVFYYHPVHGYQSVEKEKVGYPPVDQFAYASEYEYVRETKGDKKLKLLMISDSFGANIFTFLSESFGRSVKIFDAWQYKLNENIVAAEKPDVVMVVALESNIKNLLRYLSNKNVGDSIQVNAN